jgi:DNA invertase Pin-like site-specific DNA recombinase
MWAMRCVLWALPMPDPKVRSTAFAASGTAQICAAAYVRASDEGQRYSTSHQLTAIHNFASDHNIVITCVYSDEGISGLDVKKRIGLKRLLTDVVTHKAKYRKVLVYDVSRWGRFQDPDQSAYYEYLCRMNGVEVVYCAETFQNDQGPVSSVLKTIRRVEAAGFSRDLSAKVWMSQCNMARRGHVQGGKPRYGLKHVLVRDDGKPIKRFNRRAKGRLVGYHVELAPGPKEEVRLVREVFRRYVKLDQSIKEIADYLNSKGYRTRAGYPWNGSKVGFLLSEEQYIGTLTYNKASEKMRGRTVRNDSSEWVRAPNAFPAIVERALFQAAQKKRSRGREPWDRTDEDLLDALRRFLTTHGYITQDAMRELGGVPPYSAYLRRFGSMLKVYRMIGYVPKSRQANWSERFRRRSIRECLLDELRAQLRHMGFESRVSRNQARLWVERLSVYFQLSAANTGPKGASGWRVNLTGVMPSDFRLVARIGEDRITALDYYLIPQTRIASFPWCIRESNAHRVAAYRAPTLLDVAERLAAAVRGTRPRYGLMVPLNPR